MIQRLLITATFLITGVIASNGQCGTYDQTLSLINSISSRQKTFTNTPHTNQSGAISFSWIACGSGWLRIQILVAANTWLEIGYWTGTSCGWRNVSANITPEQLDSAVTAGIGNIEVSLSASDGCVAGVGCATANDPAVNNLRLTYTISFTDFSQNETAVCDGETITFVDETNTPVISRSWSFPGGSPASSTDSIITVTYNSAGTFDVTLFTILACGNDLTTKNNLIVVSESPDATIIVNGATTFCEGDSVLLSASGTAIYQWYFEGNAIPGATDSQMYAALTGTYALAVANSIGCTDSSSNGISVLADPIPVASISINGNSEICDGDSVELVAGQAVAYEWFIDGVLINADSNTYWAAESGSYIVVMVNSAGCSDSLINPANIIVNLLPDATITPVDTLCENSAPVNLESASQGGVWAGTGVAGTTFDPSAVGSGTYTVSYSVQDPNGCSNSSTIDIQVMQCVGLLPLSVEDMKLYPNPTDGMMALDLSLFQNSLEVTILNVEGEELIQVLLGGTQNTVDLHSMSPGIYFVKIESQGQSVIKKLILY